MQLEVLDENILPSWNNDSFRIVRYCSQVKSSQIFNIAIIFLKRHVLVNLFFRFN